MISARDKAPISEIPSHVSVVTQLSDILRRSLQSGEWTTRLPSERELSERFKVSRPTLRKALATLADEGWVCAEQGRGWRVDRPRKVIAHAPAVKSVGILCFVPLDEASPFNLFAIDKLQNHLHNAGLVVHVHAGTQYASQNYRQALDRLVKGSPADAWVLLASSHHIVKWFQDRNIPLFLALTPQPIQNVPAIHLDLKSVYRHALGVLLRHGHRRISLLLPKQTSVTDEIRSGMRRGPEFFFDDALDPYRGVPGFDVRWVIHLRTPESVENSVRTLFKSSEPPTALVVMRPQHTLSALTHLTTSGIRVPQDASVVSIGHEPFLDHVRPSVAHYVLDRNSYARVLCRMVLPWVRTGHWSRREAELFMQFREGNSLGPAPS